MSTLAVVTKAVVIGAAVTYTLPILVTHGTIRDQAREVCHWGLEKPDKQDLWGNDLMLHVEELPTFKACTVSSAGWDGVHGTWSDITYRSININKSRVLGGAIGSRLPDLLGGFWQGLKK